jgi:hypothetical protein
MRFKLLLITFLGFFPLFASAQPSSPPGVNASRYVYCMNEGLGKGRGYTTPQAYCQQWAGPSAVAMAQADGGMGGGIPCGMSWNGNPIYMTPSRCEAYLKAARAAEIAQHKAWLVQQAAQAKAAAAAAAAAEAAAVAAAKNNGGAIYNCSFTETSTPANGGGYPPITVPYTALGQQITADSQDQANEKAAAIARAYSNAYWATTGSCSFLILLKDL